MTTEEKREQTIQGLADMLRTSPFQVEFKVKKACWHQGHHRGDAGTDGWHNETDSQKDKTN